MAGKQGGKGKQSSPSRKASHLRGPARTEANKARKIAREAKRQLGKNPLLAAQPNALKAQINRIAGQEKPNFPRKREFSQDRVILKDVIKKSTGLPLHLVFCAGVLVEISPRQSDAIKAIEDAHTQLDYSHETLHEYGRRSLVSSRASN